jgi:sodium transport system permease protein
LLLPVAGLLAALLMAVAIRSRSVKEAQASTTVVVLAVSLLPMVTSFHGGGEQPWHLWLPALAQITLMQRVLEGGNLGAADLLLPVVVAASLAVLCLAYVARQLHTAAWR